MCWPVNSDFSLDGERVVYSMPRTSKLQTPWDVWEVPVTGGDATRLFENAKPRSTSPTAASRSSGRVRDDSPDTLVAAAQDSEPQVLVETRPRTAPTSRRTALASPTSTTASCTCWISPADDPTYWRRQQGFAWVGDERLLVDPGPGPQ